MTAWRCALELVLGLSAAAVLIPAAVLLAETLLALLPSPRDAGEGSAPAPRAAVLIPAHDEGPQIAGTVAGLTGELGGLGAGSRLVVIADNCTDDTAAAAAAAGAEVIERRDPDRRGKGFAIAFGLGHLDAAPPDVVVLLDADCRISAGGVAALARRAAASGRPVQAEYLLGAPRDPTPVALVSALAVLLRNVVRPRGLHRLGLPCQLTGSGMAFPWRVLRDAPETGSNLVEDLVMGIQMAMRGDPPLLAPVVRVSSELPPGDRAAMGQRRRWEHGQLHTLTTYAPRLLRAAIAPGVRARRIDLLALGLDLAVPPLALLVMACLAAVGVTGLAAAVGLVGAAPAAIAGAALGAVAAAVGLAWLRFGRATVPLRYAIFVPLYVVWKLPLYLSLLVRGKQKTWERTARHQQEKKQEQEREQEQA